MVSAPSAIASSAHAPALVAARPPTIPGIRTMRFRGIVTSRAVSLVFLLYQKGLPHLSGSRPRDRGFHLKGNQGTAILANSGLDTSPDNKPRARMRKGSTA